MLRRWLKFYRYAFAWENYLLLARTLRAAWLVREHLRAHAASPPLAAAIATVEPLYLPPQAGWRLTEREKIMRFADFIIGVPLTWGRCVQRSLIVYRLLNGYGVPARVCFGVNREDESLPGHAWVTLVESRRAFAERVDPLERFLPVYVSPLP